MIIRPTEREVLLDYLKLFSKNNKFLSALHYLETLNPGSSTCLLTSEMEIFYCFLKTDIVILGSKYREWPTSQDALKHYFRPI